MRDFAYRRSNCRLCGKQDLEKVMQLTPTPLADAYVPVEKAHEVQEVYPLDLHLCTHCGFLQLLDVVHPTEIYLDYIYVTESSLGLEAHFREYASEVIQTIKPAGGALVIDIGSNDGTLLRFFKDSGMRVLGIEPAAAIAGRATESGIETLPRFFNATLGNQLKNEYGQASIITSNNLVANVDDLSDMMAGIRSLLAPDGVFIFESFYLLDQVQNMVFDFTYHEHLSYFSVRPLGGFFLNNGLELIDVKRIPTKGGSLRYTVQLAGGPRPVSASIAQLNGIEESAGIQKADTFKDFFGRIEEAKRQVVSVLGDLQARGKVIAGYGASATTTTLVYHFGLGPFLSFLVDDNPSKHNRLSPGLHIPVFPSDVIYERKPDCLLVLAWRFADPIFNKHRRFLEGGGQFIVPLPELLIKSVAS